MRPRPNKKDYKFSAVSERWIRGDGYDYDTDLENWVDEAEGAMNAMHKKINKLLKDKSDIREQLEFWIEKDDSNYL